MKTAAWLVLCTVGTAAAQTRIGSWKLEEATLSPNKDVYSIETSIGNDREGSFSAVTFSCELGYFNLTFLPAPNPKTGRNDLPDGTWLVQMFVNHQAPAVRLVGNSRTGAITALVPKKDILAIASAPSRMPLPDVLTVMIFQAGGGKVQGAVDYPATRFRAAFGAAAEACQIDR